MNETSYDLSGKIDFSVVNALLEIKRIAVKLNLDFFIVGAMARDFMMEHVHQIRSPRMTKDIDIAVCVAAWDEYKALTDELVTTGHFTKHSQKQRYTCEDLHIDLIPFGDISGPNDKISWPPQHDTIMSTIGFDDVYKNSVSFTLNHEPTLEIKVPTIPGLAILKLLSWKDDYPSRKKDAEDLLFIMNKYENVIGIEDRLFGQETALLKEEAFDMQQAGIRLLGRDIARIAKAETAKAIQEILDLETVENGPYRLVNQMGNHFADPDRLMLILKKLKQGFSEGVAF